jgi:Phage integrase family
MWRRAIAPLNIPQVKFHALRHSHASALIAAGVDVVKVSRRLGHGSATITLNVYAHLFNKTDDSAAMAIEATMGELQRLRYQSGTNSRFVPVKSPDFLGIFALCHLGDSCITVRKRPES